MALDPNQFKRLRAAAYQDARKKRKKGINKRRAKISAKTSLVEAFKGGVAIGVGLGFDFIDGATWKGAAFKEELDVFKDATWDNIPGVFQGAQPGESAVEDRYGDVLDIGESLVGKIRSKLSDQSGPNDAQDQNGLPPLNRRRIPGALTLPQVCAREADEANMVKDREGTTELIKELSHQADQFVRAMTAFEEFKNDAIPKYNSVHKDIFGTCEDAAECLSLMYYAIRKYNKMLHFYRKLEIEYRTMEAEIDRWEDKWRAKYPMVKNYIKMNTTMKQSDEAPGHAPSITGKGEGHLYEGQRNWSRK